MPSQKSRRKKSNSKIRMIALVRCGTGGFFRWASNLSDGQLCDAHRLAACGQKKKALTSMTFRMEKKLLYLP